MRCAASVAMVALLGCGLVAATPREQAWRVYLAGRDARFHDALIDSLRSAAPLRESAPNTADWAYVEAILDALIQQDGWVPQDALLPFAENWRDPVLILLARLPGDEDALLSLRKEQQNLAEWLAVSNLLFRMRSERFLLENLRELQPTHRFEVMDTETALGWCGGAVGTSAGNRKLPDKFPPIALYQLDVEQMTPLRDVTLAVAGPRNVYYRRIVVPTGESVTWMDIGFFDTRGNDRELYLGTLAHYSAAEMDRVFHPLTKITWQSDGQVAGEVEHRLREQADAIRDFVRRAGAAGLGNVAGVHLKIETHVYDSRRQQRSPLPELGSREIVLE